MTGSRDGVVHLHVHTEYSMLDGASLLDGLFERTARLEMPAIAMTDHGNLHGAFDFWSKARAHGVKPIIGLEAYLTPRTRREARRRWRCLHPHDEVGLLDRGHAQPVPTGLALQHRGVLLQAAGRPRAPQPVR